jgi:hypothetical protein
MANNHEHFARHGGTHFRANVSEQEINEFVRSLPEGKKESMYEVMQELAAAGKITLLNDGEFADGEGRVGGSNEC